MSREAGPVKGGKTVIAFVDDPTGYKFELIQREGEITEPLAQVGWQWLGGAARSAVGCDALVWCWYGFAAHFDT